MAQLASAIGSVILLIATGVLIRRTKLLGPEHVEVLNQLIVYVALPSLVFLGVYREALSLSLLAISAVGCVTILACFGLAYLLGRALGLAGPALGAFLIISSLGNTGYLGYPLTIALFGQARLVDAFFYDLFATTLGLFTIGVAVAAHFGEASETGPDEPGEPASHARLSVGLVAPVVIALIAGIALKPVALPGFLTQAIQHLSDMTVPLVMIAIGMSIEVRGFRDHPVPLAAASVMKLAIAPLIAGGLWMALQRLGVGGITTAATSVPVSGAVTRSIVVLEASMPSMMLAYVVGSRYRLQPDLIASAIVLTTLLSLLTVPLWQIAVAALS
jgi:malate permease and related proteins